MSARTHDEFIDCRDRLLEALNAQMEKRRQVKDLSWIENERFAVAVAAGAWAKAHGFEDRITVDDVERVERRAMGHVDYASKLCLYVAELICYPKVRAENWITRGDEA